MTSKKRTDHQHDAEPKTEKRAIGFALMEPERRREVAREGGAAAHEQGKAHQFTPEEAREAGAKGGRAVSRDRRFMAEIGRKGGLARRRKRKK
jgi:general stress protein YciG